MGIEDESARLGVPGVSDLMGEELLIPAQGDHIHLSPRVNLNGHGLGAHFWLVASGMFTGGSHLSRTAVKPDSGLALILFSKIWFPFSCII